MLTVDGEQLNDSSFIIKALSAKLDGRHKAKKLSAQAAAEEAEWFRRARALTLARHSSLT